MGCSAVYASAADTSRVDSSRAATSPKLKTSEIDTSIKYDAIEIDNYVKERTSTFRGNAVVAYKDMTLRAAQIRIDFNDNLVTAEGAPDTLWEKKAGSNDSVRVVRSKGDPVLIQGGTQMTGVKMTFNYKTDKGLVVRGRTKLEDGQYVGNRSKWWRKKPLTCPTPPLPPASWIPIPISTLAPGG